MCSPGWFLVCGDEERTGLHWPAGLWTQHLCQGQVTDAPRPPSQTEHGPLSSRCPGYSHHALRPAILLFLKHGLET